MGFIQIALISLYYSWLHQLYQEKRLTLPEMLQFNAPLFMNIIGAAFLLWIALLILQSLFKGMQLDWLISIVSFVIVIVFNALPEVIYIEREDGAAALIAAANFTRNNWIEWFLPFLLILAPLLLISPTLVLVLLPRSEVLLPVLTILQGWELIGTLSGIFESLTISIPGIITIDPGTLLCLIPASWLMLFRGQLYSELARGSRRSRIYRMKQR